MPRESLVHLGHQVLMERRVHQVKADKMDLQETQVLLDHKVSPVLKEKQALRVKKENQERMVQMELQVSAVNEGQQDHRAM